MNYVFNVPINSVSFGQTSTLLLRTLFDSKKAESSTIIFPIGGQIDLSSQKPPEDFVKWLSECLKSSPARHSREDRAFKLWHLNGGLESFSNEQVLLSFYELDSPTQAEINCVKNNKTAFTSEYTCEQFKKAGADCSYIPLAFDSYNFFQTFKQYHTDGRIVFNLCGKFEKRKHHEKIIKAWIKKYGGDKRYALNCAVYNPFFNEQSNNQIIMRILDGKGKPFNVNFLPMMKENLLYNDFLNSGDIIIGMSGGEGWGLPEFHSVALGKHSVIMSAHGYLGWANGKNSVLVQPNGKIPAEDGIFFKNGGQFNQGSIFDFDEDEFIAGCEQAIDRYKKEPINHAGLLLQKEFSKEKFLDAISLL